jgi:Rieske Fe-S protein
LVIGAVVALAPVVFGVFTFLNPLARKHKTPKFYEDENATGAPEGFLRVASLDSLAVGGTPLRFPVIADQHDGWNFTPDQPVGAVYMERVSDTEIRCFNTTCPHAGCSVTYGDSTQTFDCPCHNSSFSRDGNKKAADSGRENPSPRGLDTLDVEVVGENVYVKFQNFYTGKHEKIPKD